MPWSPTDLIGAGATTVTKTNFCILRQGPSALFVLHLLPQPKAICPVRYLRPRRPCQGRYCVPRRSGEDERAPPARDHLPLALVRETASLDTGGMSCTPPLSSLLPIGSHRCCRLQSSRCRRSITPAAAALYAPLPPPAGCLPGLFSSRSIQLPSSCGLVTQ